MAVPASNNNPPDPGPYSRLGSEFTEKVRAERERYSPLVSRISLEALLGLSEAVSAELGQRKAALTPPQHAAIARLRDDLPAIERLSSKRHPRGQARRPEVRR